MHAIHKQLHITLDAHTALALLGVSVFFLNNYVLPPHSTTLLFGGHALDEELQLQVCDFQNILYSLKMKMFKPPHNKRVPYALVTPNTFEPGSDLRTASWL